MTIFIKKSDFSKISTNLTKCWEIFDHFDPESPYCLMHFTERPPIFCALSLKSPIFWRNLSPKDPYIRGAWWHWYVTFTCGCPPPVSSTALYKTYIASQEKSGCVFGITCRRGKYCKRTTIRVSTERKWVVKELQAKLRMTLIFVRVCTLFYKDIVCNLHLHYIQRYKDSLFYYLIYKIMHFKKFITLFCQNKSFISFLQCSFLKTCAQ